MRISKRSVERVSDTVSHSEQTRYDYTSYQPEVDTHSQVPITFYNDSDETMPPFGVGVITGACSLDKNNPVFGRPFVKIDKTSLDFFGRNYLANGPIPVESKSFGQGFTSGLVKVSAKNPVTGDTSSLHAYDGYHFNFQLGPVPDSWHLWYGYPEIVRSDDWVNLKDGIIAGVLHPIDYVWCRLHEPIVSGESARAGVLIPSTISSGIGIATCTTAWEVFINDPYDICASSGFTDNAGNINSSFYVLARFTRGDALELTKLAPGLVCGTLIQNVSPSACLSSTFNSDIIAVELSGVSDSSSQCNCEDNLNGVYVLSNSSYTFLRKYAFGPHFLCNDYDIMIRAGISHGTESNATDTIITIDIVSFSRKENKTTTMASFSRTFPVDPNCVSKCKQLFPGNTSSSLANQKTCINNCIPFDCSKIYGNVPLVDYDDSLCTMSNATLKVLDVSNE